MLNITSTISYSIIIMGTGFNIKKDATTSTSIMDSIIMQLIAIAIDISLA